MMNTKLLKSYDILGIFERYKSFIKAVEPVLLFICLILLWCFAPQMMQGNNESIGIVDQGMWVLVVLSMISFLLACTISWWLLQRFWLTMGLPNFNFMVSQFNTLELWQQLSFYWVSFALLLLAATGCIMAIC